MARGRSKLWDKYTKNRVCKGSAGVYAWNCVFCDDYCTGTKTRLVAHLAGLAGYGKSACQQVPPEVYEEALGESKNMGTKKRAYEAETVDLNDEDEEEEPIDGVDAPGMAASSIETRFQAQGSSSVGINDATIPQSQNFNAAAPKKTSSFTQSTFKKGSKAANAAMMIKKEKANSMLVRCIVEGNLSFNLLRMSCWKNMLAAFSEIGESYSGISYHDMRGKYLRKEFVQVQRKVENVKALWPKYGVTILSDGWVDTSKRALVNVLVSCCYGTLYLKSIDSSNVSITVDGAWLAEMLSSAIKEVGPDNVVQVVTDNASNCVLMGKLLEAEFPKLVWTPCASHCLDLLLEDIGKLSWVHDVHKKASMVVKLFTKKRNARKIFSHYSNLVIIRPSATRFGYILIVLERLARVWSALEQTVVSNYWREWSDSSKNDAVRVKSIILDPNTLPSISLVITVMRPLFSVLRLTDREGSTMGLLYEFMRRARVVLENGASSETSSKHKYKEVLDCFDDC